MNYRVGQKVKILSMNNQKQYNGRVGVIEKIDGRYMWGSWGVMAILLDQDYIITIN